MSVNQETIDLTALLQSAVDRGMTANQLNAENVLGLSAEDVSRLRSRPRQPRLNTVAPQRTPLPRRIVDGWQRGGVISLNAGNDVFLSHYPKTPSETEALNRIITNIGGIAQTENIRIVMEEWPLDIGTMSASAAIKRAGFFHLRFPALSTETLIQEQMQDTTVAKWRDTPRRGVRLIAVDGITVGKVDADDMGAVLFTNPFLSGTGKFVSARLEQRTALFSLILQALTSNYPRPELAQSEAPSAASHDDQLQDAILTLDLLPGFINAITARTSTQRHEITNRVANASNEVDRIRRQLTDAVRAKAQADAELEALESAENSLSMAHITTAITHINRIRQRIAAVRSVTLESNRGDNPRIAIELYPLVIRHSGQNYLFDKLAFTLPLTGNPTPQWQNNTRQAIHPHVSQGGNGNTCWGEAQPHITDAMNRKDYATLVMHIVGWATLYNVRSPYNQIENFPTTSLPPGWHPELTQR